MIRTDLFIRGTNVSLYALDDGAVAGRVYRLVAGTDVSLYFRRDSDGVQQGISAARVFGDALQVHGMRALEKSDSSFESADLPEPLTDRERTILRLLAGGYSNKEIGDLLNITDGTVKNHISICSRNSASAIEPARCCGRST